MTTDKEFVSKVTIAKRVVITAISLLVVAIVVLLFFVVPNAKVKIINSYVTNQSSNSATIVWTTNKSAIARTEIAENPDFVNAIVFYDDRDVEEVEAGKYELDKQEQRKIHHITLRNLNPDKEYYYRSLNNKEVVIEGSFRTTKISENILSPDPVYGKALKENGELAEGVALFQKMSETGNSQLVSSVITESTYSLDSSNLLNEALENVYTQSEFEQELTIIAEDKKVIEAKVKINKEQDQPAEDIVLGISAKVEVLNEFEGQVEEYPESCPNGGTRLVRKVCGPDSTAASGSGCTWGPGSGIIQDCPAGDPTPVNTPANTPVDTPNTNNTENHGCGPNKCKSRQDNGCHDYNIEYSEDGAFGCQVNARVGVKNEGGYCSYFLASCGATTTPTQVPTNPPSNNTMTPTPPVANGCGAGQCRERDSSCQALATYPENNPFGGSQCSGSAMVERYMDGAGTCQYRVVQCNGVPVGNDPGPTTVVTATPPVNTACSQVEWGGAGDYCSGNYLISCSSQSSLPVLKEQCIHGCEKKPAGQADVCKKAPDPNRGAANMVEYCKTNAQDDPGSCKCLSRTICDDQTVDLVYNESKTYTCESRNTKITYKCENPGGEPSLQKTETANKPEQETKLQGAAARLAASKDVVVPQGGLKALYDAYKASRSEAAIKRVQAALSEAKVGVTNLNQDNTVVVEKCNSVNVCGSILTDMKVGETKTYKCGNHEYVMVCNKANENPILQDAKGNGEVGDAGSNVAVASENGTLEPGKYQVVGNNVTTKEFTFVTEGTVKYFLDTNANGVQDQGEQDYSGDTAALNIQFNKVAEAVSFDINVGWNLIAIPALLRGENTSNIIRAQDLIKQFQADGFNVTHITTYRSGKFVTYSLRKDEAGNEFKYGEDFSILPGEAYFVKSYTPGLFVLRGRKIENAQSVLIDNGWNLIGVYNSAKPSYKGFEVLNQLNTQGVQTDLISKWEDGLYYNLVLQSGKQFGNDYNVYPYQGYFVRVQNRGTGSYTPN